MWSNAGLMIGLFLLAFIPRALAAGSYLTCDEVVWTERSVAFLFALVRHDYGRTAHLDEPPGGVLTKWATSAGIAARYVAHRWGFGPSLESLLGDDQSIRAYMRWLLLEPRNLLDVLVAVRLSMALLSVLTLPGIYLLSKRLFGPRIALLGAVLIAFDPFYLPHSRIVQLDAPLTNFMLLSVLSLLVYLDCGRSLRYLVLSGLCGGLAIISKTPAFFLIPFVGLCVAVAHLRRNQVSAKKPGFLILALLAWAVAGLVAILVVWPASWARTAEVVPFMFRMSFTLAERGHLQFFLGRVSNDPGPGFYPVVLLFRLTPPVLVGVGISVLAIVSRRKGSSNDLSRYYKRMTWVLVYAVLFVLFMTATAKKQDRYILPAFPALDIVAAYGLWRLVEEVKRREVVPQYTQYVGRAVLVGALVCHIGLCLLQYPYYLTYYSPLAGGPRLAPRALMIGWGEGLEEAARYLNAKRDVERLRATSWYEWVFAPFYEGELRNWSDMDRPLGADYVVLYVNQLQRSKRFTSESSAYFGPYPPPDPALADYFGLREAEHVVRLKGLDYAWLYKGPIFTYDRPPSPQHPLQANFGAGAELLGYDLKEAAVESGQALHITLHWRGLNPMTENYSLYLRLVDEEGHLWGRWDGWPVGGLLPTSRWREGMFIADEHHLAVWPGTPPGHYGLECGLYSTETGEVLGQAQTALDAVTVLKPKRFSQTIAVEHPARKDFGPEIELLGYDFNNELNHEQDDGQEGKTARPGERLPLTLYWRARQKVTGDYLVRLDLRDEEGQTRTLREERPLQGRYPTTEWDKGEIVRDQEELVIRANVAEGEYQAFVVVVGLTLEGESVGETVVGRIVVKGRERVFEEPVGIEQRVGVDLGHRVELVGYDLAWEGENNEPMVAHLKLYWRTLAEMEDSYKVFVHALDEAGKMWGQRDSVPGDGTLPTTGWARGEVIEDSYEVEIEEGAPRGEYILAVGMYDETSMERLPVYDAAGVVQGDKILLEDVQ